MKVIAINGSPRTNGNTFIALTEIGKVLKEEGVDFEIIQIGGKHIHGCLGCRKCQSDKNEKCGFDEDIVNEVIQEMKNADGIILGSPVYYSGIAGTMKCFLDRAFYVSGANGNWFRHKVGASVAAVRRTGGTMTFNSLNHYLQIAEMLIPSSNYWNVIHGLAPGDALQDAEGIQIMQLLGKNMAWMLKMKESTGGQNIEPPKVDKIVTNFIR